MANAAQKRWYWMGGILAVLAILAASLLALGYHRLIRENVQKTEPWSLYIRTGSTLQDVFTKIQDNQVFADEDAFFWAVDLLSYENVKPGRYILQPGMSALTVVRKLRSGNQDPVRLMFKSHTSRKKIAQDICQQLEMKEDSLFRLMDDSVYIASLGFSKPSLMGMFIPNTYEVYWNISPDEFMKRMKTEYDAFWNESRKTLADKVGLMPTEVTVLASIVQAETYMKDERPRIAGVYMNRLKKGILLQADPTVIFAMQDFSIKRVLKKHTEFDSPYNTYKYAGLPPGPINNPEISSIDAVLSYEQHDYLFFCARADLSGYHNFARTNAEHEKNAKAYWRKLNEMNIR